MILSALAPADAAAIAGLVTGGMAWPAALPGGLRATAVAFSASGPAFLAVADGDVIPAAGLPPEDLTELRVFDGDSEWHCWNDGERWAGRRAGPAADPNIVGVERRLWIKGAHRPPARRDGPHSVVFWRYETAGGEVHTIATPSDRWQPGRYPQKLVVNQLFRPDADGVHRLVAEVFKEVV